MRFQSYLNEDYVAHAVGHWWGHKSYSDVFCNPSSKELRELSANSSTVRFIVNFKTKKLYIWDADIIHSEASELLANLHLIPTPDLNDGEFWDACFAGTADIVGAKLDYIAASDYLIHSEDPGYYIDDVFWQKKNQSWVDKWFTAPLIKTINQDSDLFIKEEYYKTVNVARGGHYKKPYAIYLNPSRSDLKDLQKENGSINIRFIVDIDNENIYAFSSEALHAEVLNKLGIPKVTGERKVIFGQGAIYLGKMEIGSVYFSKALLGEGDWSKWKLAWAKKYFTNSLKDAIKEYMGGALY